VGGIFLKPGNATPTSSPEFFSRGQGGTLLIVGAGVTLPAGGIAYVAAGPNVEDAKWHFVAMYFNQATNQLGVSIDGAAFQTAATLGTWTTATVPTKAQIGASSDLVGRNIRLSNVWLWKGRVLTIAEVQAIYNNGRGMRYTDLSAGQKTNLLHAWELNEAAGVNRADSHGSNHLIEAVAGPVAQHKEGWTGTVDRPLTDIMSVGNRCIITCGVSIADAQEPEYIVFREIAALSGHTITFTEPFPIACQNFVNTATMEGLGADPQKTGSWGGDGDTPAYLHPYSPGPNTIGYMQRGWGTSHDLHLFTAGHPNRGLTIKGLTIDWTSSTHKRNGTTAVYAGYVEDVRFEKLTTIKHRGYNSVLFDRCRNSGVDGYSMIGDATGAIFVDGTDYVVSAFAIWSGEDNYFRNVEINGNGILLCNGEAGSINTVVENIRLTGGARVPPQPSFGVHFGSYASHFQGSAVEGIRFRNIYMDTQSFATGYPTPVTFPQHIGYFTSSTAGFTIENITFAGGEFSDSVEFKRIYGYIRVGKRIFGPRTSLVHNFSVVFDGPGVKTVVVPVGFYAAWPVLTLDTRANLAGVLVPSLNLLGYIPTGTVLNFGVPAVGPMEIWDRAGHNGMSVDQALSYLTITFAPSGSLVATRNYVLTANYFPEITDLKILISLGGSRVLDQAGAKLRV
jgi:hypothetical protein